MVDAVSAVSLSAVADLGEVSHAAQPTGGEQFDSAMSSAGEANSSAPQLPPVVQLSESPIGVQPNLTEHIAAQSDLIYPTFGEQIVQRALAASESFGSWPHQSITPIEQPQTSATTTNASGHDELIVIDTASRHGGNNNTLTANFDASLARLEQINNAALEQVQTVSRDFVDVAVWTAQFEMTTTATSKSTQGLNTLLKNQ